MAVSPRLQARIAGLLYLIVIVAGSFALLGAPRLLVPGDAAATAARILASEHQLRITLVANLVAAAAYVGVTAILYELFRPVNRTLSVVAAFLGLAGCATSALTMVNQLAPVLYAGGSDPSAFGAEQVRALAEASLRLRALAGNVSTMFFGFYCLLIGCLVLGSGFLPRVLGVLMGIAGLAWLTIAFASFLAPPLGSQLSRYLLPAAALGETSFTLWLLVMGTRRDGDRARPATAQ